MDAVTESAEGDCYLSVPPNPGIEAAALGASASAAQSTCESAAPGADSTTLTPLSRLVAVSLADPSGGPVLAHSSTVLPCPAAPSGLLSRLHLPSFSKNLVSEADLQDAWVDQFTLGGQRVSHCTCSRTGRHLTTFTRPGLTSAPCSCRPLSHKTLLWHHRLGHPSLPRLQGMASRTLVSGRPRSLPPLPPGPAPTCVPCVEGRQRAAPHSSMFPPTEAPLQTFYMVIKGDVTEVLIDWIRGACHQLREPFGSDLRVLRLHSDRGGEFSSDLLRAFCRAKGIRQTFTLPASPQQNGIAERRIGMVMDVVRMSMIHAAAPHFVWPFAVQYAAHQINLQPRVSLPETTPTLRWTGKVGDASAFRVWGSRAFVRDASPGGVEPGGVEPGGAESGSAEPRGAESERVEIGGAEPGGTTSWGTGPERVGSGGPPGVPSWREPLSPQQLREWYARCCCGAACGGDATEAAGGATGAGAAGGASRAAGGAAGAGATGGAASVGAAGGAGTAGPGAARTGGNGAARADRAARVGAVGTGAIATAGASGAGAVGGTGAGGAAGVVAGDPGAEGTGGAARPRPLHSFSRFLLQPASPLPGPSPYSGPTRGLTEHREPESRPVSPESCSALPVRTTHAGRRVSRPRPPPAPGTHSMTLHPSSALQRIPLPSPPASSLPDGPDLESDSLRTTSPTVPRFLATAVTDPLFESITASALVAGLVDFAAACRLDYATGLVAESMSASASASDYPLSVRGEFPLGTDVLEDRQEEFECFVATVPHLVSMLLAPEVDPDAPDIPTPRSYAEAIEGPYSFQWQAAMEAEMASWKSTGTYVDKVPPLGANIVSGMWIFRVKRPPSSPPVFKARYVGRGFSQRHGRDYELHSLDLSAAFLQGSQQEEIWLCRPFSFTWSFPAGTQWSLRRPVYGLCQAPCEWHDTLRMTLAALGVLLGSFCSIGRQSDIVTNATVNVNHDMGVSV
ncbi:unnamed protein product [Closterium sp. NIES-53]